MLTIIIVFVGDSSSVGEIKFNNSMEIHQMPMPKKVLLNINAPLVTGKMGTGLQEVFTDLSCSQCIDCMDRAIKAYKLHYQDVEKQSKQFLWSKTSYRNKRDADTNTTTERTTTRIRRTKPKKRASKAITVTKYNVDGDVIALKIKETNLTTTDQQNDTQVTTCQVFSVKKSFPCDTAEGESLLTVAKRKVSKKNRREKNASRTSSTKPHFVAPAFRKRQVEHYQISDNFMPSVEDLY